MDLTKGDIKKHIRQIAVPASIGFVFNTLYNVVDSFYAGQISTDALAALGLAFPVFFILIALGSGIGTGTTALIANAEGGKDKRSAKRYAVQSILYGLMVSIVLTIAGIALSPWLFSMLGAEGAYLEMSVSYMTIIFSATVFFILTFIMNAILNAYGDTKSFRNFLIAGFFMNLLLDPALMYGWWIFPEMGLSGVAWATFIIEMFGAFYLFVKVQRLGVLKGLSRRLKPESAAFKDITVQGLPAGLNMMTVALGIFIITYFCSVFGKTPVAAYGIATRIEQLILLPTIGLNVATLAIVGQNNGAGKAERVLEAVKGTIRYGMFFMTIGALLLFLFSAQMMRIFTQDADVIAYGSDYLRIAAFLTWAYVLLFVHVAALQGIKKPMFALWIGLYRQILAPIILFSILSSYYGLFGIWVGIFITVWSGAIITVIYARKVFSVKVHPVIEANK